MTFRQRLVATGLALALVLGGTGAIATLAPTAHAASPTVYPVTPVRTPQGEPWRIGYLQGGDYADYPVILVAIVRGLMTLGWVQEMPLPDPATHSAAQIWAHLATNAQSEYLRFVPDGFYTAGNFDAAQRPGTREAVYARVNGKRDIDLMIAMGTWAGQDMANGPVSVPTIVASTSDPIASRIVASAEDSGHDHIHAKVEPDRYQRQLRLFHDIVPFQTLGIVYENTPEGRTFGGVDAVEDMARTLGFTVTPCHAPFNNVPTAEAERLAAECYTQLAPTVQAVYLTVHRGVTSQSLGPIVESLLKAEVPSFSMLGSTEVQRGVLLSMAQAGYLPVGLFHAETMARIFHGAKPRELSQVWLSPAEIAINLKTAERIGFDPPIDILLASDEVYDTIGDND
ncbi:hypothetical protein IMZ29_08910 [Achromobacter sp. GG226]|uniref:ABC transporter substrate binding protein n=1 Tax=Verticiella alkaliphila TaxID=2779529 RepID=UPI001C0BB481|nr:ABC transporter substrate binding protein [Verticiella sp. GG226]MBU4610651.1 hypothetical protein [Verticiella sp. GG226]